MELISVQCYNCESDETQVFDRENGYNICKCMRCGLLYVSPRPSDKDVSAGARTGKHEGDRILDVTGAYSSTKALRYGGVLRALFPEGKLSGRWLDIGCGFGEFLGALGEVFGEGLKREGVETNTGKIAQAQEMGFTVRGTEVLSTAGEYEFISALNVFSHLPNPIVDLGEWAKLLKPEGELVLETGDSSGLPGWRHPKPYSVPDHLSFASEKIVCGILERLNFAIISIVRRPTYAEITFPYVVRQLAKALVPGQTPNFGWIGNPRRDMWIRAKLRQR